MNAWTRLLWLASRLLYAQLAWSYDLVAWLVSNGQWRTWQRVGLADTPSGRVLEMAFGPGHLLLERAESGAPMIGIDRSPQMIRQAARRLRNAGQPLRLVRGDVAQLPFASGSLQAILSTFPADFIVDPGVQREARRALTPGAPWIIIPSARITGRRLSDRVLAGLGRQIALQDDPLPGFRTRLEAVGFQVESGWIRLARSDVMRVLARRTLAPTPEAPA
ncbi:MAG: class I SAM-dependent methyltransferase [Anaerolineales bacterium]|nr:class I SAM-dependent methyltransferase [Anaerolineales bacterium]